VLGFRDYIHLAQERKLAICFEDSNELWSSRTQYETEPQQQLTNGCMQLFTSSYVSWYLQFILGLFSIW